MKHSEQLRMGEVLHCDAQGTRYVYSVQSTPQPIANGICALRVRDESSEFARRLDENVDCQLLLGRPDSESRRDAWDQFPHIRMPELWHVYQTGRVSGGPWDGWLFALGESWSRSLLAPTRLDPQSLNDLYLQVFSALLRLHDQGFVHGALNAASLVSTGSEENWKLLPPLELNSAAPEDDVLQFATVLCAHFNTPPADIHSQKKGLKKVPPAWIPILAGCLHPDPRERWTAGRAVFGLDRVPIPNELTVRPEGHNRLISWQTPIKDNGEQFGVPVLYELRQPAAVPVPFGTIRSMHSLVQYNASSLGIENPVRVCPPIAERRLQLVNIIHDEIAVFGPHVTLSDIPEVEGLTVKVRRGWCQSTWTWPDAATAVDLCLRFDRYPMSPEDADQFWQVTSAQFQQSGHRNWQFQAPAGKHTLYATAFAVHVSPHGRHCSSGAAPGCRCITSAVHYRIAYTLQAKRIGGFSLKLWLSDPCPKEIVLPPLVLAARERNSPRTLSQAVIRWNLPDPLLIRPNQPLYVDIPAAVLPTAGRMLGRLLPRDASSSSWLELASNPPRGLDLS